MTRHTTSKRFQIAVTPSVVCLAIVGFLLPLPAAQSIQIGSRLELFVDDYLIEDITGGAELRQHEPAPREVVLFTDNPWEGNTCLYYTVFQDGPRYRLYYRGSQRDATPYHEVTCYAESGDGIHWVRPELGLFEFNGSKQNNIVISGVGSHNFAPFLDTNPDCAPEAKYKAVGRGLRTPDGQIGNVHKLYAFKSPDAIHWSLISDNPVFTKGRFDSQNVAFWDAVRGCYVLYFRDMRDGFRDIKTSTSDDFRNWSDPVWLEYYGAPRDHLYTNAIQRYDRAPHLLIGFPTRIFPEHLFPHRPDQTEPTFMTSRDGRTFRRWPGAVIPVDATDGRTGNRSNYISWGLVKLPHSDREYSVYANEGHRQGVGSRLRRFTWRADGFVSVHASTTPGRLRTKPLVFDGQQLLINFATSAGGRLQVEIQDAEGQPLPGFTLVDSAEIRGDEIAHIVSWQADSDVGALANKPVRLLFALDRVDLYSFRFK